MGTSDPDLLCWIEEHNCLLVTNNRASIPVHLSNHLAAGRHVPGILVVSRRLSLGDTIEEFFLIWGASLPEEYPQRFAILPITR